MVTQPSLLFSLILVFVLVGYALGERAGKARKYALWAIPLSLVAYVFIHSIISVVV